MWHLETTNELCAVLLPWPYQTFMPLEFTTCLKSLISQVCVVSVWQKEYDETLRQWKRSCQEYSHEDYGRSDMSMDVVYS